MFSTADYDLTFTAPVFTVNEIYVLVRYDGKIWCCVLIPGELAASSRPPPPPLPNPLYLQEERAEPLAYISVHFAIWQLQTFQAFHSSESWLEWSSVPETCWVWVPRRRSEREVTRPAGIGDMGDTPVMSALWDNGMHRPASCYVSSFGCTGRDSNRDNAETCHADELGTHTHAELEEWLVDVCEAI